MRRDRNTIDPARIARAEKMMAAGVNQADICRSWGMSRNALSKALKRTRMVGRAAEGTGLENQKTATSREFESRTIRQ